MIGITPAEFRDKKRRGRKEYRGKALRKVIKNEQNQQRIVALARERGEITRHDVAHELRVGLTSAKNMLCLLMSRGQIAEVYHGGGHAKSRYAERTE